MYSLKMNFSNEKINKFKERDEVEIKRTIESFEYMLRMYIEKIIDLEKDK